MSARRAAVAALVAAASLAACKGGSDALGISPDRRADAAAPPPGPSVTPSSTEVAADEIGCLGAPPLSREGSSAASGRARAVREAQTKLGLEPVELAWTSRHLSAGAAPTTPTPRPAFEGYADDAGIVRVDGEARTVACADAPRAPRELFARDAKGGVVRLRLDPAAVTYFRPPACGCDPEAVRCAGKERVTLQDTWTLPKGAAFAGTVTIRAEYTEFEPRFRAKGCPSSAR